MKLIFGLIFVPACVLGGFVLHHGQLATLLVPTEYLIIGGCLIGGMIIKNPIHVLTGIGRNLVGLLQGGGPGKKEVVQLLQLLYELLMVARKDTPLALESHVNEPEKSDILSRYSSFLKDRTAVALLTDSLRTFVEGTLSAHDMDEVMERDVEALHHHDLEPSEALTHAADSLPAIGIVAAVLGIILTMGAIDEGAATVGIKVAGALVGTFLGVFLAYGFVGPTAGAMGAAAQARERYYQCIRHVLVAAVAGVHPATAVEIGRRGLPSDQRPTFEELDAALQQVKG